MGQKDAGFLEEPVPWQRRDGFLFGKLSTEPFRQDLSSQGLVWDI